MKVKSQSAPLNWWLVGAHAILAEVIGFCSQLLCGDVTGYYYSLRRPPLAPPGWLFGVVWALLYALMGGIAGWLYQQSAKKHRRTRHSALTIYWVQLALNFSWSLCFFRWRSDFWSIVVVLALVILNAAETVLIGKINRRIAYLTLPYFAWLTFAAYLTIGIALLR